MSDFDVNVLIHLNYSVKVGDSKDDKPVEASPRAMQLGPAIAVLEILG